MAGWLERSSLRHPLLQALRLRLQPALSFGTVLSLLPPWAQLCWESDPRTSGIRASEGHRPGAERGDAGGCWGPSGAIVGCWLVPGSRQCSSWMKGRKDWSFVLSSPQEGRTHGQTHRWPQDLQPVSTAGDAWTLLVH